MVGSLFIIGMGLGMIAFRDKLGQLLFEWIEWAFPTVHPRTYRTCLLCYGMVVVGIGMVTLFV